MREGIGVDTRRRFQCDLFYEKKKKKRETRTIGTVTFQSISSLELSGGGR